MTLGVLKFYRANHQVFGFLSNLYPCSIVYAERTWSSVEAAYQYHKFKDPDVAEWLISAPRQSVMAIAGHAFNKHRGFYRDDWDTYKVTLMEELLLAKFDQHPELQAKLKATGSATLIENSPTDSFWGCGRDGKGKNLLGVLLMQIRQSM